MPVAKSYDETEKDNAYNKLLGIWYHEWYKKTKPYQNIKVCPNNTNQRNSTHSQFPIAEKEYLLSVSKTEQCLPNNECAQWACLKFLVSKQ